MAIQSVRRRCCLLFVGITVFTLLMTPSLHASPLKVHPINSRYFMDDSGRPLYFAGSHTWYILHEGGHRVNRQRIRDFLDWLKSWGHNYTRVWSSSFYMVNETGPQRPWPYKRTGPGKARDGMPKFDLTKPNKEYFDLLRAHLAEAKQRRIYCSVMVFGSLIGLRSSSDFANSFAWHPNNNINRETRALSTGNDFFAMNPGVLALQKAHIRRMVNALNEFDNFVWEIANEAQLPESENWQAAMTKYIRQYERTKKKQHLIIMSGGFNEAGTILEHSPADIISPDRDPNHYRQGGPASYSDKIVINDTDHLWGFSYPESADSYRKWIWMTFTRGNHPIFMDPYDSYGEGNKGKVRPAFNLVRKNLGHTVRYSRKFSDLASMEPSTTISSTHYCLHDPGREYLVYDPGAFLPSENKPLFSQLFHRLLYLGGSDQPSLKSRASSSLTVRMKKGVYICEWFDPIDGSRSTKTLNIKANGPHQFKVPPHIQDDAVLHIKRRFLVKSRDREGEDLPDI